MSLSGYGAIEFFELGRWWLAGQVSFYGDVDCYRVLGDPWEDDSEEPRPPTPLKGAPKDLSIEVASMRRSSERWRAATWLTAAEVHRAALVYTDATGKACREIEAAEAFMRAYRSARPDHPVETRLVLWWY